MNIPLADCAAEGKFGRDTGKTRKTSGWERKKILTVRKITHGEDFKEPGREYTARAEEIRHEKEVQVKALEEGR